MYNVRFFDGQFIAAGTGGTLIRFYSDTACSIIKIDSITWLTDICKIKKEFIAVEYSARSRIFHSPDLMNRMDIDSAEYGLSSIGQSEDSSVIVITGNYGTILRGVFDPSASLNKSINDISKKMTMQNGNCNSIHSGNVYDILGKQIYTTGFRNGHSNNLTTAAGIRVNHSNTRERSPLKKIFICKLKKW